jgi:hypothetical protein
LPAFFSSLLSALDARRSPDPPAFSRHCRARTSHIIFTLTIMVASLLST